MSLGTKAQVTKGAKFLDEKVPGWAEQINIKKLVMDNNTNCVLGQLAGKEGNKKQDRAITYGESLGLTEKQFSSHGFEADGSADEVEAHGELWVAEVNKRLEPAKTPAKKKVKA